MGRGSSAPEEEEEEETSTQAKMTKMKMKMMMMMPRHLECEAIRLPLNPMSFPIRQLQEIRRGRARPNCIARRRATDPTAVAA